MTDYYPLIGKAVAGLEKNTGEARRVLYERARTALVGQLRNMNPPLTESEITRERLALEEAIRKVEAEAARAERAGTERAGTERLAQPAAAQRAIAERHGEGRRNGAPCGRCSTSTSTEAGARAAAPPRGRAAAAGASSSSAAAS